MRLEPAPRQEHTLRVSAQQIATSTMLHLSSDELEHAITQEQIENSALEVLERRVCLYCGAFIRGAQCVTCGNASRQAALTLPAVETNNKDERTTETRWEQWSEGRPAGNDGYYWGDNDEDEEFDHLAAIPMDQTLSEVLQQQLETLIASEDVLIAEQLVGNLNERGYLEISPEEIAAYLGVAVERVSAVLSQLQSLEPVGIGARDLRECLLLQIQALNEQGASQKLAMLLIERYLLRLGKGQFQEIARELKVSEQAVRQAVQYIRSMLNPYPAHSYNAASSVNRTGITYMRPDVIIRQGENGYEVELIEEKRYRLRLRAGYDNQPFLHAAERTNGAEMQHYVHHQADLARFFIDCVQRRWRTLKRVAELVVDYQHDFLAQGVRQLRPLTRSTIALQLQLDEGTVSRAIANKYALLPNGRLMPIADFFDSSLGVKDVLRELIAAEAPRRRFSDDELAHLLTARGITMARRTVTKYREEMGIPSSRER